MTPVRVKHAALFVVVLALLVSAAAGNEGSLPSPQKGSHPKIAVTTRLVNVDVVVTDKNGNPVTGLTANDFTIKDGGHEQRIALFTAPTSSAPNKAPLNVPPDVYTNLRDTHSGTSSRVVIILMDGLNTAFVDQANARKLVLQYLAQIQPTDHVAIYTLGNQLHILHDFTSDASELVAALSHYRLSKESLEPKPQAGEISIGGASPLEQATIAQLNQYIADANSHLNAIYQDKRVRITLAAINEIASHVQGIPGRKNLIWVSEAFPFCFCFDNPNVRMSDEERFYSDPVEQTAQHLADAGVAIYPVDARGLFGVDLGLVSNVSVPSRGGGGANWSNFFTMENFANWTGGRAFFNTNDIMGSIRRAVDDSRLSYVLGYYPDHKEWKGEFRKIKVKVDRPGLQVRTREGYFAIPEMPEKKKNVEAAMAEIANSPLDATAIGFAVRITPFKPEPSNRATPFVPESSKHIQVTLHFDPHPIRFTASKGRENADIQYAIFELDENGKVLTGTDKSAKISVPEAQYQTALKEGMGFDNALPLLANANELCVILRDNLTGSAGSVHIPLAKYQSRAVPKP